VDLRGRPNFANGQVYVGGDALRGPATVVEAIADAARFARAVLETDAVCEAPQVSSMADAVARKGILQESARCEGDRCLQCRTVCECCADVCPNRANVVVTLPGGSHQILHVDQMCNECGNCAVFCPYDSAPYKDKFTLFHSRADMEESPENSGFLPLGGRRVLARLGSKAGEFDLDDPNNGLPAPLEILILTVMDQYGYLMD